jgi:hypothetical protein
VQGNGTYILEGIHDGRLGTMDAVVLVSAGLAPPVEHDDGHLLPLGERGVVGERPLGRHRLQNQSTTTDGE